MKTRNMMAVAVLALAGFAVSAPPAHAGTNVNVSVGLPVGVAVCRRPPLSSEEAEGALASTESVASRIRAFGHEATSSGDAGIGSATSGGGAGAGAVGGTAVATTPSRGSA